MKSECPFFGIFMEECQILFILWVILFLNEPELICSHRDEWFQVLLSKTNSFICTQLNGFKYSK